MKVQISLDDDLVTRIDNIADTLYMSRSGFISFACVQYLNSVELMNVMKDISITVRKIADSNTLDDDDISKLEDIERLCRSFNQ